MILYILQVVYKKLFPIKWIATIWFSLCFQKAKRKLQLPKGSDPVMYDIGPKINLMKIILGDHFLFWLTLPGVCFRFRYFASWNTYTLIDLFYYSFVSENNRRKIYTLSIFGIQKTCWTVLIFRSIFDLWFREIRSC